MSSRKLFSIVAIALLIGALVAAGCGSSNKNKSSTGGGKTSAGALSAEAQSAATGDIPDNQAFLTFRNASAGYSMQYPEGWSQRGSGRDVTFQDKNNLIRVVVSSGSTPTAKQVGSELSKLKASSPSLAVTATPRQVTISRAPVIKAAYSTRSAPNPVTGKRVTLLVDRYELASKGKRAAVDLGTPKGVDNVDAYLQIIKSFRWK
jgi:hypothetical protein